ncbi:MAG TPA: site-specific integrase [Chitinophagaceae bacterium]|nr:site-specific integrase [Chitinophagaceae bacterium]
MPSVSIIYRKDKLNKKGEAPIHFRIIKNRKTNYISSGIMLPQENWDFKNKKIKAKNPNSARLNSFLANKFTELQDQVFEHETLTKSSTTKQLKEKIYGKKPEDFFSFADEVVSNYKADGKISTYITHSSTIRTLKEYVKKQTLMFQDITPEFLTKYERHLQTKIKLKTNTIHKHLKFLRKLFNDALRLDKIEYQHNPFPKYKLKLEKTTRSFLSDEEFNAIEAVPTVAGERLDLHKQMFIFAAYTGGLRVSDVLKLQWKNFDNSHIHIAIHKTKSQLSIKLPNKAIQIINQYHTKKSKPTDFIFPMLENGINLDDPQISYQQISSATAYINKNLKILAQKAGLEKPLSFHISRHTWATRALRKGISIDKVSKLMGHAQLRETQIYAKIVNEELDKAMDVFND